MTSAENLIQPLPAISPDDLERLHLATQHKIARILIEASTVEQAINPVLKTVCEDLQWDVGAAWLYDPSNQSLRCLTVWHPESVKVPNFEKVSFQLLFGIGVGLPGRVAQSLKPAWISSVSDDPNFPRGRAAMLDGLKTGFAFPIIIGGEILAVLEFLSKKTVASDNNLSVMMATVGLQIAQFIKQKQSEDALKFISEAGILLSTSLDYQATLIAVSKMIVPRFADLCIIDQVGENGTINLISAVHTNPCKEHWVKEMRELYPLDALSSHPVFKAMQSRKPRLIMKVTDLLKTKLNYDTRQYRILKELNLKSVIIIPLIARDRILGALTLCTSEESGRVYHSDDMILAEEIGRRAALAIDNARLYQSTLESIKEREEILSIVSHDLKNPLEVITMSAGLALKLVPKSEKFDLVRKNLTSIQTAVGKADQLIRDLLESAQAGAGSLNLDIQAYLASELIEDAVSMLMPLIEQKSLKVERHFFAVGAFVACDRDRVLQIFSNLIGNAIKFTQANGIVSLGLEATRNGIQFSVTDTGLGIPNDQQKKIFDRYWQAKKSGRAGSGLGLSIAKSLVEAQRGRIWVESEPGKGSSFFFLLPQAHPEILTCTGT